MIGWTARPISRSDALRLPQRLICMMFCAKLATAAVAVTSLAASSGDVSSRVMSVMSRSFLVESLLMTDDVKHIRDNNRSSSSSSSIGLYSQRTSVADVTVNHLATPYSQLKLTESTCRNEPRNATAIRCCVPVGSEMPLQYDRQLQYHRLAPCGSCCSALLDHCVRYQSPSQVVVADVQLRRLAAAVHTSAMCTAATTNGQCSMFNTRNSNNVCQSLKLAGLTSAIFHDRHRDHDHIQQRSRAHLGLHDSCMISASTSSPVVALSDDNDFPRQTGQQSASLLYCFEINSAAFVYVKTSSAKENVQLPAPLAFIGCLLSDPIPVPKRKIILRTDKHLLYSRVFYMHIQ